MKKVLFVSLCVATLMSCGQKQGPSEQEIQERIDAAVKKATEEKIATTNTTTNNYSQSANNAASNESRNPMEIAYKKGYDYGMEGAHIYGGLNYFLKDDSRMLKQYYMNIVASQYGIGDEYKTNRDIFDEFKRGFIKGHQDGNAL